ncbi:hypothetical protein V6N11_002381 [Hibiscus sabdariffa]|uniref:RNase H type-1 domain-containing protein n=1 Tax=Hibiscus sabdariffa TaxID=183260 RepID=A0ABR2SAT6_9ROSI
MDLQQWLTMNLTNPSRFVRKSQDWNLLFGAIVWNLWLYQNSIVFDNPLEDSRSVLIRSQNLQRVMQAAKEARSRGVSDEGTADFATWKLPPEGWFKVNTDGARNSSNGMACCGSVIRDDEGRWSVDAVLAVNKCRKGFTRMSILNQVLDLIDKAWEVQVCRIPRRINRAADGMAKVARFDSLECDGFEVPPPVIVDLLRLDALDA